MRGRIAVLAAVTGLAAGVLAACGPTAEPGPPEETVTPSETPAEPELPAWTPTAEEREAARRVADGLSLRELAGQLIVGTHTDETTSLALLRERHFAGVLVTGERITDPAATDPLADIRGFNERMRRVGEERGVPVMVPVDQEGGIVTRIGEPLPQLGSFMTAGAAVAGRAGNAASRVGDAAAASGAALRAAGFTTVFAPVADVTPGPADPVIGSRSAGSDPQVVAEAARAAVEGYGRAGVVAVAKHFPGHNVTVDSHERLPTLDSSPRRLLRHDLAPFRSVVEAGVAGVMTGHLLVPALDAGAPASVSPKAIARLRGGLRHEGLVVSDALDMGAIVERFGPGQATVAALRAGSDLALMPVDNVAAHEAVLSALRSGELPESQARASAARVIATVEHHARMPELETPAGDRAPGPLAALARAAVTMAVEPCRGTLSLDGVVPVGDTGTVARFTRLARARGLRIGAGRVVGFVGWGQRPPAADVLVATDTPYVLADSTAPYRIAIYGETDAALVALLDVLTGEAEAPGRLPVDVAGLNRPTC